MKTGVPKHHADSVRTGRTSHFCAYDPAPFQEKMRNKNVASRMFQL